MAERAAQPRRIHRSSTPALVVARAVEEIAGLTGRPVEGVSALERTDDGWRLEIEIVELQRVPDTTSVLASYEVELDGEGELTTYRRLRRYHRASTEES